MDRGYTRARYLSRVGRLRDRIPGMAISTDLIVGFPGETVAEFQETIALMREVEFDQVFAFVFSPRPGTAAARLEDDVPRVEKEARLQEVLAIQEETQRRRHETLVGREFEVLVDGAGRIENGLLKGRTRCNRIVHLPAAGLGAGRYVRARIERAAAHSLQGSIVSAA
jgi:tRNA-2-methylthio-N6-dimethylallyladenosine synthase